VDKNSGTNWLLLSNSCVEKTSEENKKNSDASFVAFAQGIFAPDLRLTLVLLLGSGSKESSLFVRTYVSRTMPVTLL
jgi:hypothetical protein